jgi:hypothetical protein
MAIHAKRPYQVYQHRRLDYAIGSFSSDYFSPTTGRRWHRFLDFAAALVAEALGVNVTKPIEIGI